MIRVADYIMEFLRKENVGHVFTVTGRGILYLTDALARCDGLTSVCVHHEQAASYAAYAYAEYGEQLGACLVSTGCAATNAVTGLLCCWQDGVPCIFISGQNMLHETSYYTKIPLRTYGSQEANIVEIVKPLTKYAVMLTRPEDVAYELEKAVSLAREGRMGPVWVDVPLDIQNMRVEPEELRHYEPSGLREDRPDGGDVEFVKKKLERAKRPVILIGSGVRQSGGSKLFRQFVEKYRIPVVFAPSAADTYGVGEKWSIGAVGSLGGSRAGNFALQNSDLVLVLGNRLSPMITGSQYGKFAREAELIVVDIDETEHTKDTVKIDRFIRSDVREFLTELFSSDCQVDVDEWGLRCLHWKEIFSMWQDKYRRLERVDLHYLSEVLSKYLEEDAVVVTDAGFEELILPASIAFRKSQRCIHPVSQGAMGFALPASVGASFASGKTVVSVNGDGSVMMNLQELQTISYYHIPVKIIIVNNNCYAVIRKRQQDLFRTRTIGTDSSNGVACPSFEKVAECFGISYMKISSSNELEDGIQELLEREGPVICEIMCVEQQEYLHTSYKKGISGRMVRPSLEDLSPFLEREQFLSEMVIEPIDQ